MEIPTEKFSEEEEEINQEEILKEMIKPEIQQLYQWEIQDEEPFLNIILTIPEGFDSNLLKFELNPSHTAISVTIPDSPPIFKGKLFEAVETMKIEKKDNIIIINFRKPRKGLWPFIIEDYFPDTEIIDPQSAFILGTTVVKSPTFQYKALNFLHFSAKSGYVAAMSFLARFMITTNSIKEGIYLFTLAIQYYNSVEAMVEMADSVSLIPKFKYLTIPLLKQAINKNYLPAHASLGRVLSPLSQIKGFSKDVKESILHLELAGDNPIALHELAMLYFNGVGVKKDLKKASDLQLKAKKLNPKIPILTKKKTSIIIKFIYL